MRFNSVLLAVCFVNFISTIQAIEDFKYLDFENSVNLMDMPVAVLDRVFDNLDNQSLEAVLQTSRSMNGALNDYAPGFQIHGDIKQHCSASILWYLKQTWYKGDDDDDEPRIDMLRYINLKGTSKKCLKALNRFCSYHYRGASMALKDRPIDVVLSQGANVKSLNLIQQCRLNLSIDTRIDINPKQVGRALHNLDILKLVVGQLKRSKGLSAGRRNWETLCKDIGIILKKKSNNHLTELVLEIGCANGIAEALESPNCRLNSLSISKATEDHMNIFESLLKNPVNHLENLTISGSQIHWNVSLCETVRHVSSKLKTLDISMTSPRNKIDSWCLEIITKQWSSPHSQLTKFVSRGNQLDTQGHLVLFRALQDPNSQLTSVTISEWHQPDIEADLVLTELLNLIESPVSKRKRIHLQLPFTLPNSIIQKAAEREIQFQKSAVQFNIFSRL